MERHVHPHYFVRSEQCVVTQLRFSPCNHIVFTAIMNEPFIRVYHLCPALFSRFRPLMRSIRTTPGYD